MLKAFIADRSSGLLFQTDSGRPMAQSDVLRDSLHKFGVKGFHTFRRFRATQVRMKSTPWDLEKFWLGHANKDVGDLYIEGIENDVALRKYWDNKVGLGFSLIAPQCTSLHQKEAVANAA